MLLFVNKKTYLNPYIVVLSCRDYESECMAKEFLQKQVQRCVVKSKSAQKGAVELNMEIRMREENTDFINISAGFLGKPCCRQLLLTHRILAIKKQIAGWAENHFQTHIDMKAPARRAFPIFRSTYFKFVYPIRLLSTSRAASRPSRMAHTTKDCPRRISPAANTLSIFVW